MTAEEFLTAMWETRYCIGREDCGKLHSYDNWQFIEAMLVEAGDKRLRIVSPRDVSSEELKQVAGGDAEEAVIFTVHPVLLDGDVPRADREIPRREVPRPGRAIKRRVRTEVTIGPPTSTGGGHTLVHFENLGHWMFVGEGLAADSDDSPSEGATGELPQRVSGSPGPAADQLHRFMRQVVRAH